MGSFVAELLPQIIGAFIIVLVINESLITLPLNSPLRAKTLPLSVTIKGDVLIYLSSVPFAPPQKMILSSVYITGCSPVEIPAFQSL